MDISRAGTSFANALSRVLSSQTTDREPLLAVQLIRTAAFLSLFAGVIMLIAASAALGVAIILLSALYLALAEIINYLSVIARHSETARRLFEDDREPAEENFQGEFAER